MSSYTRAVLVASAVALVLLFAACNDNEELCLFGGTPCGSGGTGGGVFFDGGSGGAPADAGAVPGGPCGDGGVWDRGGACCEPPRCAVASTNYLCTPCDGGADAGDGGDAASCAHDRCTTGGSLDPLCDPCVAVVCGAGVEPYCCGAQWDVSCLAVQGQVCGVDCMSSAACPHSLCVVGGPLPGGYMNACSLPAYRVCNPGDGNMPSCCTVAWTAACVAEAAKWEVGCP